MKCYILAGILATELSVLGVMYLSANTRSDARIADMEEKRSLVRELGLTDLAVWSEARYTRHPSQADRFAAFQDFPSSIEHFPAGAIIAPPVGLRPPPYFARGDLPP